MAITDRLLADPLLLRTFYGEGVGGGAEKRVDELVTRTLAVVVSADGRFSGDQQSQQEPSLVFRVPIVVQQCVVRLSGSRTGGGKAERSGSGERAKGWGHGRRQSGSWKGAPAGRCGPSILDERRPSHSKSGPALLLPLVAVRENEVARCIRA